MTKNTINIVYITDKNYLMPTIVSITSIKENKNQNSNYRIHIICKNLSILDKRRIKKLNDKNFNIILLNRNDISQYECKLNIERHVSTTAIYKFFLPTIFNDMEKIIYLDSDVLVQSDLKDFYNTNINENYGAVVKDYMTRAGKHKHLARLNYPHEFYFNSGVLLLNLEKMRKDKISEKLLDYRINGINHFMDQDALNIILANNVKFMDIKYNMLNVFFEWYGIENLETFYETKLEKTNTENYKNAVILHLGSDKKPWLYNLEYLTDLYRHYYLLSPYKNKHHKILNPKKINLICEKLFSISNSKTHKIYKIAGIKLKIKNK